mmetsp:Transcript_42213/g.99041  ORF Transcript_42213/g.99041 Transcript_42213/m.99041 type:complete len:475 (-) Transcript_42213:81-1505(-)
MASFRFSRTLLGGGAMACVVSVGAGTYWSSNNKAHCLLYKRKSSSLDRIIHHKIIIVGGGTAGVTVASQLLKQDLLFKLLHIGKQDHRDIAVVEPSDTHFYQPLWSMVAAGLYTKDSSARPTGEIMPEHAHWIKDKVDSFRPEDNTVTLKSGCKLTYDYLIVAAGIQQDWSKIPGLEDGLKDPNCPVVSTYDVDGAAKTYEVFSKIEEGDLLFTMPAGVCKSGTSAAQKPMWLWEDALRKKGVRHKTHISFHTPSDFFFHIDKYDVTLKQLAAERDVEFAGNSELIKIDVRGKTATFKDAKGNKKQLPFDALHVVPPQSAPAFVKNSPLADKDGFVEVDQATLQHVKFKNVFALGDCCNAPTTKTAAAVASQAPVVVHNIVKLFQGKEPTAQYDGYSGCPILTGKQQVLLCEHAYGDVVKETFTWDQKSPSRLFYIMQKDFFPWVYWYGFIRGSWYGRNAFRAPPYPDDLLFRD